MIEPMETIDDLISRSGVGRVGPVEENGGGREEMEDMLGRTGDVGGWVGRIKRFR